MLVTIYTDASHCHETNKGSYAFWISSDVGRFTKSGVFKDECKGSTQCEIMAVVNALHFCRTHGKLKHATKIIVNTDNINVIRIATNPHGLKKKFAQKEMRQLRGFIQKYIGKFRNRKCEVVWRYIKAHQQVTDKKTYVNDFVDKEARKELRNAR